MLFFGQTPQFLFNASMASSPTRTTHQIVGPAVPRHMGLKNESIPSFTALQLLAEKFLGQPHMATSPDGAGPNAQQWLGEGER